MRCTSSDELGAPERPTRACHRQWDGREQIQQLLSVARALVRRFDALADACGLAARTIGCVGHILAEVRIDGRWYKVDNACRHPWHTGQIDALFQSNFMQGFFNYLFEFSIFI